MFIIVGQLDLLGRKGVLAAGIGRRTHVRSRQTSFTPLEKKKKVSPSVGRIGRGFPMAHCEGRLFDGAVGSGSEQRMACGTFYDWPRPAIVKPHSHPAPRLLRESGRSIGRSERWKEDGQS